MQKPSVTLFVTWVEMNWLVPLWAWARLGSSDAWLGVALLAFVLDLVTTHVVRIQSQGHGVRVVITKLWQLASRGSVIALEAARLEYWSAWFCRGCELRGDNGSIAISTKRGTWLSLPEGAAAIRVRPPWGPTARSFAANLPNIAVTFVTLVAVWPQSLLLTLLAASSLTSSLLSLLTGGPQLLISPRDGAKKAPPVAPAEAL